MIGQLFGHAVHSRTAHCGFVQHRHSTNQIERLDNIHAHRYVALILPFSAAGKATLGKAVAGVLRAAMVSRGGLALTKDSIDLGIIVEDEARSLEFYMGTLGLRYDEIGMFPLPDGSVMHRLLCGTSLIKIRQMQDPPPSK